jgi:hypothetical protein
MRRYASTAVAIIWCSSSAARMVSGPTPRSCPPLTVCVACGRMLCCTLSTLGALPTYGPVAPLVVAAAFRAIPPLLGSIGLLVARRLSLRGHSGSGRPRPLPAASRQCARAGTTKVGWWRTRWGCCTRVSRCSRFFRRASAACESSVPTSSDPLHLLRFAVRTSGCLPWFYDAHSDATRSVAVGRSQGLPSWPRARCAHPSRHRAPRTARVARRRGVARPCRGVSSPFAPAGDRPRHPASAGAPSRPAGERSRHKVARGSKPCGRPWAPYPASRCNSQRSTRAWAFWKAPLPAQIMIKPPYGTRPASSVRAARISGAGFKFRDFLFIQACQLDTSLATTKVYCPDIVLNTTKRSSSTALTTPAAPLGKKPCVVVHTSWFDSVIRTAGSTFGT